MLFHKKIVKMKCCVENCTNDSKIYGITFHKFPKEKNLRSEWLQALGLSSCDPDENSVVCSEHFQEEDFYQTTRSLQKMNKSAIPFPRLMSEDLDGPATLLACRICLSMDVKMFHMSSYRLSFMYQQLTGLTIDIEDHLPQNICWECVARLSSAHRFRLKALKSHGILSSRFGIKSYISIRDVKSALQCHSEIKTTLTTKDHGTNNFNCDINENDDDVKIERIDENDDVNNEFNDNNDFNEHNDDSKDVEIEIKNENNEIYVAEMQVFDSDDDKALSEVYNKKKVKKKKVKMIKKIKVAKEKSQEEASPSSTMDKYKTSDVKRRKNTDGLDESLFTITSLTYEEQIAEIEKRQETTLYKTALFKCTACYRGFHIKHRYDAHVVRHSEQSGAYECFICKTRSKTARALRKHLTSQHTEQFSCKGCPFVTKNRGVAREHQKWHAGTKYQCPHCPSEFDKVTTYMGHIRIKHVSDFVCELCGFTFVSKKGIEVHKKKKHRIVDKNLTMEGPYCQVCDVRFVSEEAYERHLKLSSKHSSDSDPNRLRNDSQSATAEGAGRVVRKIERRPLVHARSPADGARDTDVTCEQCGIQLRDLRLYAQHFRRTHPDKNRTKYPSMKTPCMCELCGRIFQSMALLKDHMWVHTGEKRFKCDRCDKSFTQKTNLVFHMRVHSASRPSYECPLCGKHFAFFNNRRRHMFIHTGLKPFKCDTCGKCFTTSGEQRAHIEHVHLKKPWPKRARARCADDGWKLPGED